MMSFTKKPATMVLIGALLIVALAFGVRHSFGLLMRPITLELSWGRETLSLVFGLQALLNGFMAPFAGAISDRWGVGRTIISGCGLYGAGLVLMAYSYSESAHSTSRFPFPFYFS